MAKEDEEKTSFTTLAVTYYYVRIPFRLKNTVPTFQRTMRITLQDLQSRNVEAYVDDIVVKTRRQETFLRDLSEAFDSLRTTRLKMNPEKCVFGVPTGKLMGFLVSSQGIEVNSAKVEAINRMQPPTRLKEAQRLTGCMAALGRFISKLRERGLPFFKLIKKTSRFDWTEDTDKAFRELKEYLTLPPVLVAPREEEDLLLYISATPQVISAVLVAEREEEEDSAVEAPSQGTPAVDPGTGAPRPEEVAPARTTTISDSGADTHTPRVVHPGSEVAPTPGAMDPGTSPGASMI
jgi:hypothetical protein